MKSGHRPGMHYPTKLLSALLLLASLTLVSLVAFSNQRKDASHSLADSSFYVEVETPPGGRHTVTVPLLFSELGLGDAPVLRLSRPVTLENSIQDPALLFYRIRYAAEVYWDDELVGRQGRIGTESNHERSDASFLVALPEGAAEAGDHTLEIRVEGAFGEGGVLEDIFVGPRDSLTKRIRRRDIQQFGLTMSALVLAAIQLMLVLRRPDRREHLYFALFFMAVAAFWFANSDAWYLLFQDLGIRLRVRRAGYLLVSAFAVLWTAHFAHDRTTPFSRVFATVCGLLAIAAAVTPDLSLNATLNSVGDGMALVMLVLVGIHLVQTRNPNRVAAYVLLLAAILAGAGIVMDMTVARGGISTAEWLNVVFACMVVGTGTALSIKHSDARHRYARLLQSAQDGILVIDERGHIEQGNQAARELLLLSDEDSEQDLFALLDPKRRNILQRHLRVVREEGRGRTELLLDRLERKVWLESQGTLLDGGRILLVLRDISHRRHMESGLLRAARMETVGYLSGAVVHDINNLMGALLGHVGALRSRLAAQGVESPRIKRVEEVARTASAHSRRLLSLVNEDSEQPQPTDVVELARSAVSLVEPMLEPGIRLEFQAREPLPPAEVKAQEIREVLVNLLVNARDVVSPEDGHIRLTVGLARRNGERPTCLVLCVDDNGPGVPEEERERVFEAFFSTKSGERGLGLGLAVVAQVVRAHGGQASIQESSLGGARVRIVLPLGGKGMTHEANRRVRILVVEDDEEQLALIREHLGPRGYQVALAGSSAQALDLWNEADSSFDVLVTDVVLGDGSGLDLAARLQGESPALEVVIISGFVTRERIPKVLSGEWWMLDKPYRLEQLSATLREALDRRRRQVAEVPAPPA